MSTRHNKGFTLIETLIAVLVLSFLLIAVTSLMSRTLEATTISQDRFVAAKLAQEGIELIKAKRNYNITFAASPWTKNLFGTWEPDSTQEHALATTGMFDAFGGSPRTLCKRIAPAAERGQYWYNCASDEAEPLPGNFTRVVQVDPIPLSDYSISVSCTVTWNGGADSVVVSTVLYRVQ